VNIGQLYIVEIKARPIGEDSYERAAYLTVADSSDAVEKQIRYVVDLSQYSEFSIKNIRRVKPFHRLWTKTETIDEKYQRDESEREHKSVEKKKTDFFAFEVGVAGTVVGASESHVFSKLGRYFSDKAAAIKAKSPFKGDAVLIIEERGCVDQTNTRSADRMGALQLEGRALPGGLPSLGRRA
jgi:hypothetical protein